MWSYFFIFDWIKIITIRYAYKVHDQINIHHYIEIKSLHSPLLFSAFYATQSPPSKSHRGELHEASHN